MIGYNKTMQDRIALVMFLLFYFAPVLEAEMPCGLTSIQETSPLIYPPIAKAAHVTGQVILIAEFSTDGSVHSVNVLGGPEMLRKSAIDFVQGWDANSYGGSRNCPIVIDYKMDTDEPNGRVVKKDMQHYAITGDAPCLCDPAAEISKRRRRFGIF